VQCQARYFFLSAHGYSSDGHIEVRGEEDGGLVNAYPQDVGDTWKNNNVSTVIIAGCSILNIFKDYGKEWAKTGPTYLLGYRDRAPNNIDQNGDKIIGKWCDYFRQGKEIINSWKDANYKYIKNGGNASAVRTDITPHKFYYFYEVAPGLYRWDSIDSDGSW
jgi:hypothetical protein